MTAALDESVGAQRRLVADASHELRTPLTSLTTNLELRPDTSHRWNRASGIPGMPQPVLDVASGDEEVTVAVPGQARSRTMIR